MSTSTVGRSRRYEASIAQFLENTPLFHCKGSIWFDIYNLVEAMDTPVSEYRAFDLNDQWDVPINKRRKIVAGNVDTKPT